MAIITAFRFGDHFGAICVDQESWHIFRRKNWFTDHLYPLVPKELAARHGVELIYGGVGHPPFHFEVQISARKAIKNMLENRKSTASGEITVLTLSRLVLHAFHEVHRRRTDDALRFLFGFGLDDYNAGFFIRNGTRYPIKRKDILERAKRIVSGREPPGYGPFSPPVEACLIGLDMQYGFSAYALKEMDGVLAFQSCGFESIGQGRDGAAIRFAKHLNSRFLESRRAGDGSRQGIFILLDAICESMEHYGQNGGFVRYMILDGDRNPSDGWRIDVRDDAARLSMEIVRGVRAGLIPRNEASGLLSDIIDGGDVSELECRMFRLAKNPRTLGYVLRGYKVHEDGLPGAGPEEVLFSERCLSISEDKQ